jgi:autotransporter-associated beta strand protein
VGISGTGFFSQAGGTVVTTGSLSLANSVGSGGTYELSSGLLLATSSIFVGSGGTGTFTQTGGTVQTQSYLVVGAQPNASGLYTLAGGTLTEVYCNVGQNTRAVFIQTGGTHTLSQQFVVGFGSGADCEYRMSGGTLDAGNLPYFYVGTAGGSGRFLQSGGTVTYAGAINFGGGSPDSVSSTYRLGGGLMSVGAIFRLDGQATFSFDGGTLRTLAAGSPALFSGLSPRIAAGGAIIDVPGSPVTVEAPLLHDPALGSAPDGGLSKLGPGTLRLSQGNTYTGPTTVSAGTLAFTQSATPYVTLLSSLTLTATGTLDLANNLLIVRNTPESTLRQYVSNWFAGGTRTGTGLATSLRYPAAGTNYVTLAVFPNNVDGTTPYFTSLAALPLLHTDTIVAYTYLGDTNIDGRVDGTDLANFLEGYANGMTGWQCGDFNYDNVINTADFNLLKSALSANLPPLGGPSGGNGDGGGSIPEPSALALLPLAALPLSRRRR